MFIWKKVFQYHRLVRRGRITRLMRLRNKSLYLCIDKPCSKTSCIRGRNRRKTNKSSQFNLCDTPTPEKPKGEFKVIEEDEDDFLSLAS